jgi:DHA2 family multidrug resistance protein
LASAQDIANRIPITGALMLATLMYTLDSTIANVALPHIQGSVSAAQDQITWVLTSYIIATAIMTPLSGWLSEKIGRKRMFMFSIAGFTVASMLCGTATSLPEIVIYRLLQGIAGASLMPLSQAVMLDVFPQRMIPRVMSLWSAAVILGPIVGPTLGGWLTESLSWRWVFYINLPIGILAFLGIYSFMAVDEGGRQRPFDFVGFGALALFIGAFQLMLDRGPGQDWLHSREVVIEAAVMAAGLYVFITQTLTAEHPFFHRDLAKDANYVGSTVFGLFVGVLLFSTSALLPLLMQNLLGYSALQSGWASMPRGLGSLIAFVAVPWMVGRMGARPVLVIGVSISMAALWQMSRFDLSMTPTPIMISGFVQGLGTGLMFAPLSALGYATLDPSHRTEGTIVATMTRTLGSSVGISVVQALLINNSALAHARLAERIAVGDPMIRQVLPAALDPTTAGGLQLLNAEVTRQGAMIGYSNVFGWMTLAIILLAPLILLMQPAKAMRQDLEPHAE